MKDEKWPWIDDKKSWDELFSKTIKVLLFNFLITFPIIVFTLAAINKYQVKHPFELD